MSAEPKLPRWTEPGSDAPSELAELLRAGRAPLGTAQEVAQLAQGLGQVLGPAAAGLQASSLAAPAASAGLGLARWAAWAAAVAGSAGALWYFTADSTSSSRPPPPSHGQPPSAPVEAPPVVEPSAVVEPAPEQVVEPAPEQAVEPAPEPPAVEPAPKVPRAPAPTASSEVELLRRAQALLAAQPGRALQLTNEHQRRFRDGVLAEEREALAIEALRRLGRAREAQRRAALFQRRYPSSVHTSRVRGSVAPPSTR